MDLNLAIIGNCAISALIDRSANVVWACLPRFDGDPAFNALLGNRPPESADAAGLWSIDVENLANVRPAKGQPKIRVRLSGNRPFMGG